MTTNRQNAKFDTERTRSAVTFTGAFQTLGAVLAENPSILIAQNDTDVAVTLSDDGTNDALTLIAGASIVLDLRTNRTPQGSDLTFPINTQFYVKAAVGTGTYKLSIIYAR